MRLYAESPGRIARQLVADLLAVLWFALWIWLGLVGRDLILALQGPARFVGEAGAAITGAFDDAARTADGVPLVGGDLADALSGGSRAGTALAQAGQEQVETIASVATATAIVVALLGSLPVLLLWLPRRLRYARAAGSAVAARAVDPDLLAVRALAGRPVGELMRAVPEPARAWRSGDPDAVHRLAALELAALGLRPGPRNGDVRRAP